MRRLWTPWRMSYIKSAERMSKCFLCEAPSKSDSEALIVHRSNRVFVILNAYPYNTGHVMVAPYRHVADLEELDSEESLDLLEEVKRSIKALKSEYSPQGFNMGINLGRVSGAGLESHVHVHIVPRWSGDTNFMPIVGGAKVLPEDLETTWSRLRRAFDSISK